MSDEKKPFAVVEDDVNVRFETNADHAECIRCVCLHQCGDEEAVDAVAIINAAVERERREAAVKALRYAADMIEPSEIKAGPGGAPGFVQGKEDGLTIAAKYLRARAEIIERGEQ